MKLLNNKQVKKLIVLLLAVIVLSGPAFSARYRFSYRMNSDVRLSLAFIQAFRMFFEAQAGILLDSKPTSDGLQFNYRWINGTGWRIRTHRRGSKVSIVTADYSFDKAKKSYQRLLNYFKKTAPFYAKLVAGDSRSDKIAYRPFKIVSSGPNTLSFTRNKSGGIKTGKFNLYMTKPADMPKYNDSFNIYRILHAMLEFYSHDALNGKSSSQLTTSAAAWYSKPLNYTALLNKIQKLADYKSKKYFSFNQKSSFRLRYKVVKRDAGKITVIGVAFPDTPVWKGRFKIEKVYRKITVKSGSLEPLEDTVYFDAKSGGQGWQFRATLKKI